MEMALRCQICGETATFYAADGPAAIRKARKFGWSIRMGVHPHARCWKCSKRRTPHVKWPESYEVLP